MVVSIKPTLNTFGIVLMAMILLATASDLKAESVKFVSKIENLKTLNSFANAGAGNTKIYYLDFWASWCPPCAVSFPWMNEIQKEFSNRGLKVIAVSLDSNRDNLDKFLINHPAVFDVKNDSSASLAKEIQVAGMPHSFILNSDGEVLYSHIGFRISDKSMLRKKIEEFLALEEK